MFLVPQSILYGQHTFDISTAFYTCFQEAIVTMLNLNQKPEATVSSSSETLPPVASDEPVWKILIFDQFCQDIISSVLRVSDLRENGVTVHMYAYVI